MCLQFFSCWTNFKENIKRLILYNVDMVYSYYACVKRRQQKSYILIQLSLSTLTCIVFVRKRTETMDVYSICTIYTLYHWHIHWAYNIKCTIIVRNNILCLAFSPYMPISGRYQTKFSKNQIWMIMYSAVSYIHVISYAIVVLFSNAENYKWKNSKHSDVALITQHLINRFSNKIFTN